MPRAAGVFLMTYAVYRFVLGFSAAMRYAATSSALTTSQFWSLPTFAAGALLCFIVARRGANADPFRTDVGRVPPANNA